MGYLALKRSMEFHGFYRNLQDSNLVICFRRKQRRVLFHRLKNHVVLRLVFKHLQLTVWCRIILEKLIRRSSCQESVHILWNPDGHYHVHRVTPSLIPVVSQMNPVCTPTLYSILIFDFYLWSFPPRGRFPSGFLTFCIPFSCSLLCSFLHSQLLPHNRVQIFSSEPCFQSPLY